MQVFRHRPGKSDSRLRDRIRDDDHVLRDAPKAYDFVRPAGN
jgi:hypothetical protein